MHDDKITKLLEDIKAWLIGIWVAIICLMVLTVFSNIASAQSAVVSFDDAEQLAAISDSITGVRDSTLTSLDGDIYVWDITCRELVCRTVETHVRWERCPTDKDPWRRTPGTAIITWREVKP